MTKITLRDYLEGIEELIEDGKIDETIAHCRHILKSFPKNVATYRLLGKAHLEEKRYGDAGDIFQRVLSSAPDDFVSHVGMSIIREDEGNLDVSISHMERAFESQPSNRAVQDELRRLYGQREGFAPPKVRLTRAALARMYSHGDLFNQAIGELRSAIREDGPRPELLILLAEMYAKTEQFEEALKTSAEILEKLPYCLYANHLSADILSRDNNSQEANDFMKKVEELDPYQIHTSAGENPKQVGAEEVVLEHLILHTSKLENQEIPRAWTGALEPILEDGVDPVSENLPDWLSVPPDEEDQEELETPMSTSELKALKELAPDAPKGDDEIPSWMQELHPEEDSNAENSGETISETISPFESSDEIEAKDSIASTEKIGNVPNQSKGSVEDDNSNVNDEDGLAWLEGLAVKQGASEEELISDPEARKEVDPDWIPEAEENTLNVEKRSLTWWLDELEESEDIKASEIHPEEIENIEEADQPSIREEAADEKKAIQFSPAPGALAELDQSDTEVHNDDKEEDTPDWLKDLADDVEDNTQSSARTSQEALENPPDWLEEFRASADESNEEEISEDAQGESSSDTAQMEKQEPDDEHEQNGLDILDDWVEPKTEESLDSNEAPEKNNLDNPADINEWVREKHLDEKQSEKSEISDLPKDVETQGNNIEAEPEAEEVSTPTSRPVKIDNSSDQLTESLTQARQALNFDKFDDAVDHYVKVLRSRKFVDEVIADLQAALMRHPRNVALWQTLGDAFMRGDRLREALDSYTQAEDLL